MRLVSASDKLHNARAILADYRVSGEKLWKRFNASREEQLWYYSELATTFRKVGPKRLGDELGRVVSELKKLTGQIHSP